MPGRIITARHGRPNLARDVWISAREYGEWWAAYDRSGLHPDEAPPPALVRIAEGAEAIYSSTLPRAVETARHLLAASDRSAPADILYVEAPLPPPPLPLLRLRPGQWGVVSRIFWIAGYAPGEMENHAAAWRRVDEIIRRLGAAAEQGDVVLCAHGYLNWMIDRRLTRSGWSRVEHVGANRYWSWRAYAADEPAHATVRKVSAAE